MNDDRTVSADAVRARMAPVSGRKSDRGVAARDNRLFVEGVLRRVRTGCPWRDLPARFGKWNGVFQRFRRLARRGVFQRVSDALSDDPDF
ncbi:MAG: transposase, partial [Roseovarius sp.]|nr:transposase [Roseovarius sp.]